MGHLTDAITKLEKHLLGVGKILGLTIALETGDAQRFVDAGNFSSYCRCVKSLRTSNEKKKGENKPQVRQQVSGLGVRGSRALRLPLR